MSTRLFDDTIMFCKISVLWYARFILFFVLVGLIPVVKGVELPPELKVAYGLADGEGKVLEAFFVVSSFISACETMKLSLKSMFLLWDHHHLELLMTQRVLLDEDGRGGKSRAHYFISTVIQVDNCI